MYSYKGVFSRERRGKVVDVICVFTSLGCDKYI